MDGLIAIFNEYTKTNPVIAGAISLWGLTVVSFLLRNLPRKLYDFLYKFSTVTISLRNDDEGYSEVNYVNFLKWFDEVPKKKWVRSYHVSGYRTFSRKDSSLTIGIGSHYFIYKKHLFKMTKAESQTPTEMKVLETVTITMFGRDVSLVEELVNEFAVRTDPNQQSIYTYAANAGRWVRLSTLGKRSLDTVIVNKDLKAKIMKDINWFITNKEWYTKRGLPYKLVIIMHGQPGTGKTSLIKAIANEIKRNVSILNLESQSNNTLQKAINCLPEESLVVVEDFDSLNSTKDRSLPVVSGGDDFKRDVSLSALLNTLDGICSLEGDIVIMTTNVLSDIDSALTRKGRTDFIYEIPVLTHVEIVEYINLMFPGDVIPGNYVFNDILGCDLQALYFENTDNFTNFVESIPREWDKCLSLVNN